MAVQLSQPEVVGRILKALDKLGAKHATSRQVNAVIEAANLIVAAFGIDDARAAPGRGIYAWLVSDDTGRSSKYMAFVLAAAAGMNVGVDAMPYYPLDSDDFGRCVRLLDVACEPRPHLSAMQSVACPVWRAIAAELAALEALYREEKFPQLNERLRDIIAANEQRAGA